jgi:hypothetical protein
MTGEGFDWKGFFEEESKENSNLRKHLLWAAQFLSAKERQELKRRLQTPPLHIAPASLDDERDRNMEIWSHLNRLCDHVDKLIAAPDAEKYLDEFGLRLSDLTSYVRDWLGPEPEHTLISFLEQDEPKMIDVTPKT